MNDNIFTDEVIAYLKKTRTTSPEAIANEILDQFMNFGECTMSLNGYAPRTYKVIGRKVICKHAIERAERRGLCAYDAISSVRPNPFALLVSQIVSVEYRGLKVDTYTVKNDLLHLGDLAE